MEPNGQMESMIKIFVDIINENKRLYNCPVVLDGGSYARSMSIMYRRAWADARRGIENACECKRNRGTYMLPDGTMTTNALRASDIWTRHFSS